MTALEISFETMATPQCFAHIASRDGLLGHAAEIKERIPVGTWLTIQPCLQRLTAWMTRKCGFTYMGSLVVGDEVHDLLLRED